MLKLKKIVTDHLQLVAVGNCQTVQAGEDREQGQEEGLDSGGQEDLEALGGEEQVQDLPEIHLQP
jgi:hypothetical protein